MTESATTGEFLAKGYNRQLLVKERSIVISRRGALAFMTRGLKGDTEVPLEHITSIQMKNAGLVAGYIQFTLMGGTDAKGGLFRTDNDENFISFQRGSQKDFEQAKRLIDDRKAKLSRADASSAALDPMEQLAKAAELHKAGVLTDEEFAAKKKQLLGL